MIRVQLRASDTTKPRAEIEMIASRLTDFREPLAEGLKFVREVTRQRFEARGFGEWPPLAESTVARKVAKGSPEPERQLYDTGALFESATSENGPYSFTQLHETWGLVGVDWSNGGWQVPVILSQGIVGRMPARPIWPPGREVTRGVSRIIRNWVRSPVEHLALGGAGEAWVGAATPPLPPI